MQDYVVPARPEDTVLDCLLKVKRTIDPTLAFRYSCGHGMCGSDAVSINGTPTLLCTATVKAWAKQPSDAQVDEDGFRHTGEDVQPAQTQDADDLGVIELAPLPGFPVQRDLIADIDRCLAKSGSSSRICRPVANSPPPRTARSTHSNICRIPSSSPSMSC